MNLEHNNICSQVCEVSMSNNDECDPCLVDIGVASKVAIRPMRCFRSVVGTLRNIVRAETGKLVFDVVPVTGK